MDVAGVLRQGQVHRTYDEFRDSDSMISRHFRLRSPKVKLPNEEEASVASMGHYIEAVYADRSVRESTFLSYFLSINWDGSNVAFMNKGMTGFMKMILWDRLPDFMPERERIL